MASKRRTLSDEEKIDRALEKARGLLAGHKKATASQLGNKALRPRVLERLLNDGYEPAGKGIRVPLRDQGQELLAEGAHLPVDTLHKRLAGTTKTEAGRFAKALALEGRAHLVLRSKQLVLVPPSEPVVDREHSEDVASELKDVLDWLRKVRANKSGAVVLAQDLGEAIEGVNDALNAAVARAPQGREELPLHQVLRGAILAVRDEDSLLASVPEVSRRIRTRASPEQIKGELLAAHGRGDVELRPEGGIGRLSDVDAALCPVGAGGVPLGWVRLLEE